jgi:uncharacterized protein (DUF433 family)
VEKENTMSLLEALVAQPPPLRKDEDDVLRIGDTRVRLESILGAFHNGATPEEILFKYPSLNLTDIYAVITYYLWHPSEVETYLQERKRLEEETQQELEARFPPQGIRERLFRRVMK